MASASAELKPDWYEPLLPFVPDFIVRKGVVSQLEGRLKDISAQGNWEQQIARKTAFVQQLKQMDIAIHTKDANEQHYEVPSEFYTMVLGKNLKYSCCLYTSPTMTLDEAEDAMLATYVTKAQLVDGQDVLDLGCGWGSLSLYLAAKFPNSRITGLSNSATQREFIMATAQKRGLKNVNIVTGDIRVFDSFPAGSFDRVCSIEMFEHMKNYEKLLDKISRWLRTEGKLFVHIFCHKFYPYHYETAGENNWMARHFFTGGTMPSADLLIWFQRDLVIVNQWAVNGENYARTSEDWLKRLDSNPAAVRKIFAQTYGEANADKWVMMWRLFFLAVAEMFRYGGGNEWGVAHYLFEKKAPKP